MVVNDLTFDALQTEFASSPFNKAGFLNGYSALTDASNVIRVDQGLDTTEIPATLTLDPELVETQYIIELDSRFAAIRDYKTAGNPVAQASFVDDDLIASYYVTRDAGSTGYVTDSIAGDKGDPADGSEGLSEESILGPRGTNVQFGLQAATDVVSSNYLFNTLGTTITGLVDTNATFKFIDTTIKVTGVTTGYRIDIPLRIVKKQ